MSLSYPWGWPLRLDCFWDSYDTLSSRSHRHPRFRILGVFWFIRRPQGLSLYSHYNNWLIYDVDRSPHVLSGRTGFVYCLVYQISQYPGRFFDFFKFDCPNVVALKSREPHEFVSVLIFVLAFLKVEIFNLLENIYSLKFQIVTISNCNNMFQKLISLVLG
jgi:hypothetical protein